MDGYWVVHMVAYLETLTVVQVSSAVHTTWTAAVNTLIVIDTSTAAVTVTMPAGATAIIGNSIIIKNAPANGPEVGGAVVGNTITIDPAAGETIEGNTSDSLGPPTEPYTEATRQYWPTSTNSGTSPGEAGFTGWCH